MKYLTSEGLKYFTEKLKSVFAKSSHKHTTTDISNFPSSLPANGGNADTVDGKHASDLQNYNNLTNKPLSLKNPYSLTMQFNGTTQKAYDGSSSQTLNITPSGIGAAAGSHTHANDFFNNTGNLSAPYIDTNKYPSLSDIDKSCCLYILNGTSMCSDAPTWMSGYCITITGNGNRKQLYLCRSGDDIFQRLKESNGSYKDWKKINDGGNADTVDGYHSYQFQNFGSNGTPEGTYLKSQYDGSKGKFYIKAYDKDSGNYLTGVYVDYAANTDKFKDKEISHFISMGNEINASNTDFNNILTSGFYNVSGSTLLSSSRHQPPNTYQYGVLVVADAQPYAKVQMYYSHHNDVWTRVTYGNSDGFTSWVKAVTSETLFYSENEPGSLSNGNTVMLPE